MFSPVHFIRTIPGKLEKEIVEGEAGQLFLVIPEEFRKRLGKRVVVGIYPDGCVFIYPIEDWDKIRIEEELSKAYRIELRTIFGFAEIAEVKDDGKLVIPAPLYDKVQELAFLGKNDIYFKGCGNRIEVWDKLRWDDKGEKEIMRYIILGSYK